MREFELEFFPKKETRSADYISLIYKFGGELAINGLVLDGGQHLIAREKRPVLRVVAQDDDAITQENMNYDTRTTLARLVALSSAVPAVIPGEECIDIDHCRCESSGCYILQAPPEWLGSPVKCGDCGRSVPLYRLVKDPLDRDFSELLRWRRLYRAYLSQYFAGFSSKQSLEMVQSCVSTLSLHGRRLCGHIEVANEVITLYPLYSRFENLPRLCPQCGKNWVNPYTDAIKYERFCRPCRLVMKDEGNSL